MYADFSYSCGSGVGGGVGGVVVVGSVERIERPNRLGPDGMEITDDMVTVVLDIRDEFSCRDQENRNN